MEQVVEMWKKHKFGMTVAVLAILLVISFMAQSQMLLILSGAALIIICIVQFIRYLVRESTNGNVKKLLTAFSIVAGIICVGIGIFGYIAISSMRPRMSPSEFDQMVALGEGLGGASYMRSSGGFSYMAAKNRIMFLAIGALLIFGPMIINLILNAVKKQSGSGNIVNPGQQMQSNQVATASRNAQTTGTNPPPVFYGESCCICGGSLQSGHAVLFARSNGTEAKIDENCWGVIDAIFNTQDQRQLLHATRALHSRLNSVDPEVGQCIQGYINYGNQRMTQM